MTSELSVPLSRANAVFPGEEVDVAVEMVAPAEVGRYLGYWRLTGPAGRRKFGQRVWCHVQVVDPKDPPPAFEDMAKAADEISSLMAAARTNDDDDDDDEHAEAPPCGGEARSSKAVEPTGAPPHAPTT